MAMVTLGKTGLQIEQNGFGCLPLQRVSKEDAAYLLRKAVDGGMDGKVELYLMNDQEPLMSVDMSVRPLTEKLPAIDLEGKQLINVMQLEEMDQATAQAIEQDATSGLSGVLINAVTAAPDEIQALMTMAVELQ